MSGEIPDLWSNKFNVSVRSPAAILRAQAAILTRKTQGIVSAKVTDYPYRDKASYALDVYLPMSPGGMMERVLVIRHSKNKVYPTDVFAQVINTRIDATSAVTEGDDENPFSRKIVCYNEHQFMELLKEVLNSNHVISAIQSAIAHVNDLQSENDLGELGSLEDEGEA